jgi:hypothetical protein
MTDNEMREAFDKWFHNKYAKAEPFESQFWRTTTVYFSAWLAWQAALQSRRQVGAMGEDIYEIAENAFFEKHRVNSADWRGNCAHAVSALLAAGGQECPWFGTPFGSYENYVSVKTPQDKWICVDACMVPELAWLWSKGIETIECCCGHSTQRPYVAVSDECRGKIEALGYKTHPDAVHCYSARTHAALNQQEQPNG